MAEEPTGLFSELPPDILSFSEFLGHFYEVISRYIVSGEKLDQVFNLFVVQKNKNKKDADEFKRKYLLSLSYYSKQLNEVQFAYHMIQSGDVQSLKFILETKRRLLIFYDLGSNMGISLSEVKVPIRDWLNLLKSFPFFNGEVTKKLENFKRFLSEENEDLANVSGLDFTKALLNFSNKHFSEEEEKIRLTRKTTSPVRFSTAFNNLKLTKQEKTTELLAGKLSQKFGNKLQRGFLKQAQGSSEEQAKDLQRHLYKESRLKRLTQQAYYQEIEQLRKNSVEYDHLYKVLEEMRLKLLRLSEIAKKNGVNSNIDVKELVGKSQREELALELYSKMKTIGF